jgi:predicted RNA binding protein YcfA (HicA-like mRNA interferase family)
MSQREKLIARIRARPSEAYFTDVRKLLELFGWNCRAGTGSHRAFTKPGERTITVPIKDEKVRRVYLDEICERLGLDD